MKTLLLLLLLLLPILSFAQNKFEIGVFLTNELSFVKVEESFLLHKVNKDKIGYCYSTGVKVSMRIQKRLFLRGGIGYGVYTAKHFVPSLSFPDGTDVSVLSKYKISSINLPFDIGIVKKISKNKRLRLGVGMIYHANIKNEISRKVVPEENKEIIKSSNVNEIINEGNFSPNIFVGIDFTKHKNITYNIEFYVKRTQNKFKLEYVSGILKSTFQPGIRVMLSLKK